MSARTQAGCQQTVPQVPRHTGFAANVCNDGIWLWQLSIVTQEWDQTTTRHHLTLSKDGGKKQGLYSAFKSRHQGTGSAFPASRSGLLGLLFGDIWWIKHGGLRMLQAIIYMCNFGLDSVAQFAVRGYLLLI